LVAQLGDVAVAATTDDSGNNWITYTNTITGAFTYVLVNYDPSLMQMPTDALSASYQPDVSKWSLAWDADTGSWTGIPPGGLTQTIGAGALSDGWNFIVQDSRAVSLNAATAPPRSRPGGVSVGGWNIRHHPLGGIIEDPFGGRFEGQWYAPTPTKPNGSFGGFYQIPPVFGGGGRPWSWPPLWADPDAPKPPPRPPGSNPFGPLEVPPLPGMPKKDPPPPT
jgi:hypothetical protein